MRIFFKYTLFYSTHVPSEGNLSNNRLCCYKDECWGSPYSQRAFIDTGFSNPLWRIYKCKKKVWRSQEQQPGTQRLETHKIWSCVIVSELLNETAMRRWGGGDTASIRDCPAVTYHRHTGITLFSTSSPQRKRFKDMSCHADCVSTFSAYRLFMIKATDTSDLRLEIRWLIIVITFISQCVNLQAKSRAVDKPWRSWEKGLFGCNTDLTVRRSI